MKPVRPLSVEHHGALRINPIAGAAQRPLLQIGLSEIALVAADMPICLAKDGTTGRYNLIALAGLIAPSNLFVLNGRYQATYLPRSGSFTAFRLHPQGVGGLALDENDASVGDDGDRLFDDGSPSQIVRDSREAIDFILRDIGAAQQLVDAYAARRLIRPLKLELRLEDGGIHQVDGLYAIDEDALAELDDATIVAMHRADQLAPAAVFAASLAQVERLRQLHNAAHDRRISSFTLSIAR